MSKLTESMGAFRTGDLVFVRYPPRGTQPIHVTVFLEPEFGLGECYVHAGDKELEIAPRASYGEYKDAGGYLHACTTDAHLRNRVAAVAALFAREARPTPYGHYPNKDDINRITGGRAVESPRANRFGGMIGTRHVDEIPFEFAALRRLLKWTLRAVEKAPLSKNRGITCAAFSAACHQVAGMLTFFDDVGLTWNPKLVRNCLSQLDPLTASKADLRANLEVIGVDDKTGKTVYKGQALPANSNRPLTQHGRQTLGTLALVQSGGRTVVQDWVTEWTQSTGRKFKELSSIERFWLIVQHDMLQIPPVSMKLLESIIDPAFFFDAKYVSSPALAKALVESGSWKTTEYKEY